MAVTGFAAVYAALGLTSFAALAASAQAADTHLGVAAVMGFGHLHSTTLLIGFVPLGGVLLRLAASQLFGRIATWSALALGLCAVLSLGTLLSAKLDEGPFGAPLFFAFAGIPIWTLLTSLKLLRHDTQRTMPGTASLQPEPGA